MYPISNPGQDTAYPQSAFSIPLLQWYQRSHRKLPWRETHDPYAILVSEVMLQQTQVKTVAPYYLRWMKKYPTVQALAAASETEALKSWEGLGYYRRARLLRAAARQIVSRHKGRFPDSIETIEALPGVGPYTLGAVASIAFNLPMPVLDGNVIRVLCRWFGIRENTRQAITRKKLWALAETLIPKFRISKPGTLNFELGTSATPVAGDFNQAVMELGATLCVPHNPFCLLCPIREGCRAFTHRMQHEIPSKIPHPPTIRQFEYAGLVICNQRVLLYRRRSNQRMANLWQFPSVTLPDPSSRWPNLWKKTFGSLHKIASLSTSNYSVTNHRIRLEFFRIQGFRSLASRGESVNATSVAPGTRWVSLKAVRKLTLTAAHRKLADRFLTTKKHKMHKILMTLCLLCLFVANL